VKIVSADVLSSHLRPLCSRDNHVMKYESGDSRANTGDRTSYHCGYAGCGVRYNSTDGFHMLMEMSGQTYAVDEPEGAGAQSSDHQQRSRTSHESTEGIL